MSARRFAMVFAALAGTPLLVALLLSLCPSAPVAVVLCLALAACGVLGAAASIRLLGGAR